MLDKTRIHGSTEEVLDTIGEIAYNKIQKTADKEEYAFYLGIINVVASVLNSDSIDFNYAQVKKDFETARFVTDLEKENKKQMSMDDLLTKVCEYIDKKLDDKSKTNKKSTKE